MNHSVQRISWISGLLLGCLSLTTLSAQAAPLRASQHQSLEAQQCTAVRSPGGCTKPIKKPPHPPRPPK